MDDSAIYDLFMGQNPAASAGALASAIRQRRAAATIGGISGDPAISGVAGQLSGQADELQKELASGAQHRASQQLQQQHYATEQARQQAQEAYWQALAGAKQGEVGATTDAAGNPVFYGKHRQVGGALPGAMPSPGGAPSPQTPQPVGGAGPLSEDAINQAAELYSRTGKMPSLGRGKYATAIIAKIASRAAQLHPEANLAENQAGFGADTRSLGKMQSQADAVNAFERTAMSNLDQFLGTAKSVVDTGSPLFNMPARKFMEKVAGDPKMTQFNVARQVAVQEIGKVLGGSMGSAAISDSARHEVESLLSPDASLAQIEAAANILRRDMNNRKAAFAAEIAGVRSRAGGGKPPPEVPTPAQVPMRKTIGGKTYEKREDGWYEVTGG